MAMALDCCTPTLEGKMLSAEWSPGMEETNKLVAEVVTEKTLEGIKLKNGKLASALLGDCAHLYGLFSGRYPVKVERSATYICQLKEIKLKNGKSALALLGDCAHLYGMFSGKYPVQVDRPATYLCQQMTKFAVKNCLICCASAQLLYAVDVAELLSLLAAAYCTEQDMVAVSGITNKIEQADEVTEKTSEETKRNNSKMALAPSDDCEHVHGVLSDKDPVKVDGFAKNCDNFKPSYVARLLRDLSQDARRSRRSARTKHEAADTK